MSRGLGVERCLKRERDQTTDVDTVIAVVTCKWISKGQTTLNYSQSY